LRVATLMSCEREESGAGDDCREAKREEKEETFFWVL